MPTRKFFEATTTLIRDANGTPIGVSMIFPLDACASLDHQNLSGLDLRGINLAGARLLGANLVRTHLQNANLHEAWLTEANLEMAELHGADLTMAHLNRANLSGTMFGGANLCGADLSKTRNVLISTSCTYYFKGAAYNDETKFPDGFDPALEGMVKA